MAKTLVFGHKNPDTDTICSAIVYANLKNKLAGPSGRTGKIRRGEQGNPVCPRYFWSRSSTVY